LDTLSYTDLVYVFLWEYKIRFTSPFIKA